jgi:hypothetical protein
LVPLANPVPVTPSRNSGSCSEPIEPPQPIGQQVEESGIVDGRDHPAGGGFGERDAMLYRDVHGRDIQRTFAAEALLRDELPSRLDAGQFEARLIDLHRQVRNDFAEGGAHTLFLAVGFLRWKKKAEDERSYRAPLLLVPVRLERRSASSRFTIRFPEDEPRFNATLLQFLERDFELALAESGRAIEALLAGGNRHGKLVIPKMPCATLMRKP